MKILFLSIPTGGGHHQAAIAMDAFFSQRPGVECRVVDIAENVNTVLADAVSKGYILSTTITPKLYGTLYDWLDLKEDGPQAKASATNKMLAAAFRKKLYSVICDYDPDVIVSTHLFITIVLNRIQKHHTIRAKTVSIVTDFRIHPMWEQAHSDYYVTASELLEFQAIKKWGDTSRVLPFGIPVHPKFAQSVPKEQARKALGLSNKFTVLLMMGSMGYGTHSVDLVRRLNRLYEDIQIVAICGSNKKLKAKLSATESAKPLKVLGFVNNVDEYMDAADCIITKPGGLSTSEALCKHLPILMLDPIPGQEDRNREFMLNNGLAMSLSEFFCADEAVQLFIHHPETRTRMIENAKAFSKPDATKNLCDFIRGLGAENL